MMKAEEPDSGRLNATVLLRNAGIRSEVRDDTGSPTTSDSMGMVAKGLEIAAYGALNAIMAIMPLYGYAEIIFRCSMSSSRQSRHKAGHPQVAD